MPLDERTGAPHEETGLRHAGLRALSRRLPIVAGLCLLAACADRVDPAASLACRTAVPPLHEDRTEIAVSDVLDGSDGEILVRYRAQSPDGSVRRHTLACRFGDRGPPTLAALSLDGHPLSEVRLYLLNRYWMEQGADAASAAPAPATDRGASGLVVGPVSVQTIQVLIAAITTGAVYALIAISLALVYGLVGRVFFAAGEFAAVGGYATASLVAAASAAGLGREPTVLIGLAVGVVGAPLVAVSFALWAGRPILDRLARWPGYGLLVATFGLVIATSEALRLARGSSDVWIGSGWVGGYELAATASGASAKLPLLQGAAIATAAATILGILRFMRASGFGRSWRAVSDDMVAAELLGTDVSRVMAGTLALSAVAGGVAGWFIAAHYGVVTFSVGLPLLLKGLVAAVLGGVGSLSGAVLGGLLLGLGESLWMAALPGAYRDVAVFGLLVALLAVRPGGLLGWADRTPRRV